MKDEDPFTFFGHWKTWTNALPECFCNIQKFFVTEFIVSRKFTRPSDCCKGKTEKLYIILEV